MPLPIINSQFTPAGLVEGRALVSISTSHTPSANHAGTFYPDSKKARRRRCKHFVLTTNRLIQAEVKAEAEPYKAFMVTLTYSPGTEWASKHITAFTNNLRTWASRRQAKAWYLWVLELTKAGTPHYHILIWLPTRISLPKKSMRKWWPHGLNQAQAAGIGAAGYLAKGLAAERADKAPKNARTFGAGGLSREAVNERAWWRNPAYVRRWCPDPSLRPRRAKGGGWIALETGEYLAPEFIAVQSWPLALQRIPHLRPTAVQPAH